MKEKAPTTHSPSSRIDVTDSHSTAIRNRLTAAAPAAAPSLPVARFRLVAASGVADRGPAVGTNVDRARSFALAVFLDRDLTLTRFAALAVAAAAGLSWFRRGPNPTFGTRFTLFPTTT